MPFLFLKLTLSRKETALYRFGGYAYPSGLSYVQGDFYGTTVDDGAGYRTVFELKRRGSRHELRTLYSFAGGHDGAQPSGPLLWANGAFYGTTRYGGLYSCRRGYHYVGCGTVFRVTTSGEEKVLYEFEGSKDGESPVGALVAAGGVLYGVTTSGGANGAGTVFAIDSTSGKHRVLHSFKGGSDGELPEGALQIFNGTLYGTTPFGGSPCSSYQPGCGTIFQVTRSGEERVIHRFAGEPDGTLPFGDLLIVNSRIYGTTTAGGSGCDRHGWPYGCGTVFTATTSGEERLLYRFKGSPDGWAPLAQPHLLYGTTQYGGHSPCSDGDGCGTVFRIAP
jgi:uncharacterized repeat protein (TIGR03803 family)